MSSGARIAVAAAAVAAAVVLFVVLSNDDDDSASSTITQARAGGEAKAEKPQKPEQPEVATIVVKDGQPVGGVQELTFTAGDDIRFTVESDTAAEVHFHGYDVMEDVEAGGEVSFDVPADIEGVFEVELEETATQIAEVTVEPG
jgi:plastocyanin